MSWKWLKRSRIGQFWQYCHIPPANEIRRNADTAVIQTFTTRVLCDPLDVLCVFLFVHSACCFCCRSDSGRQHAASIAVIGNFEHDTRHPIFSPLYCSETVIRSWPRTAWNAPHWLHYVAGDHNRQSEGANLTRTSLLWREWKRSADHRLIQENRRTTPQTGLRSCGNKMMANHTRRGS